MFSWLKHSRIIYTVSNLLVLPAILIPKIDLISNISFLFSFFLLVRSNLLLALVISLILILKNNANYRFVLLLSLKGPDVSESDSECVYLYAWCTLLRYFLIGLALNQIFLFFK